MNEKIFEAQYDVTKKTKIVKFYQSYKIFIYSFVFVLVISLGSFSFYLESKKNKIILLSEKYLQAKIYLENGNAIKAKNILENLILSNDPTYSTLSLYLIMNQNLISERKELLNLFDHILKNSKISNELKNLLIYKKILLSSNSVNESQLLESAKPLLNKDTVWKPHVLIMLGDYFSSKKEYIKAIDFYQKVFSIKNLHNDLYRYVRSQLEAITNE